jgi:hypothetical protein
MWDRICAQTMACVRTAHMQESLDRNRVGDRVHLYPRGQWRLYKTSRHRPRYGGGTRASSIAKARDAHHNHPDPVLVTKTMYQWGRLFALPIQDPVQGQVLINRFRRIFAPRQIRSDLLSQPTNSIPQLNVRLLPSLSKRPQVYEVAKRRLPPRSSNHLLTLTVLCTSSRPAKSTLM